MLFFAQDIAIKKERELLEMVFTGSIGAKGVIDRMSILTIPGTR
jgi:hypothetical protein